MELVRLSPVHSLGIPPRLDNKTRFKKLFSFNTNVIPTSTTSSSNRQTSGTKSLKLFTAVSPPPKVSSTELESTETPDAKFDWYAQWYPIMPVCDLDKRVPHGKKVMGLDVVVWWDRTESAWKVFDDTCPHRLAPLSEGRIDQWGRLQCVYHGWCFSGAGDCNFIPQAPPDGPPFHTFRKACVGVYPSTVANDIVWFWPNTDPKYKDILMEKKPPFIPELNDPSYTKSMGNREFPFGYEILLENLMDPSHVPYAHYGILKTRQPEKKADREGGRPLDMKILKLGINGFTAKQDWDGTSEFLAPCLFYARAGRLQDQGNKKESSVEKKMALVFFAVPVSPGKSRMIFAVPRNFGVWIDKVIPRWIFHIGQNLILDSDLYLLHVEERKILEFGSLRWQQVCFIATKADALIVGFRKWFNQYAGGEIDWRGKYSAGALPPSPPRDQLMDRYWSHGVNCTSCSSAYKALNALEVVLQIASVALIGVLAFTKAAASSMVLRSAIVSAAILCFVASKWLAHFVYKNFHFHDYIHAFH